MAKGEADRTRNMLDTNSNRGNDLYNNTNAFLGAQANQFQGDYGKARESDDAMRNSAMSGYQNFADTGGFSPTSLAAMRSRAVSPIRANYANAERNIGLARTRGGTSAGANTLMSRMAREQGQAGADATTNAEAGIGQLVQQGKLAGLNGMTNLYGTTPGQTGLFSRNVLENANQGLQLTGMEYGRMQDLLNTQAELTKVPGTTQQVLGNIKTGTDIGANIFSAARGRGTRA